MFYWITGGLIISGFITWKIYLYFRLREYRKRIIEFRNSISKKTDRIFYKVAFQFNSETRMGFVLCNVLHIYPDNKTLNVCFKDPSKSFSKPITKDVSINDLYPHWAIPVKKTNIKK